MKRVLFLLISLALCCLFAISVSAVTGVTSDEFGEITYVSGIRSDTQIKDKTSRVVLLNVDGTYTTYPAYYISDVVLQWQGTVQYDFKALNSALGTSYSMNSIVRLEILSDSTVMNQNGGSFQDLKNLREVAFPKDTQMREIGGQQFKSSTLEKIVIPATVTKLGSHVFENCASLKEVTFEEGFSITSIPNQMFTLCKSLEKITLPDCVVSIGAGCFSGCSSLREIRFGKSFKTVGNQAFSLCKSNMVIYAPSTFMVDATSITTGMFSYDSGDLHSVTMFFEGTQEQAGLLVGKATHRGLKNATMVEWDPSKPDSYYIPENPTNWTIVYSYNMCSHKWSEDEKAKVTDFFSPVSIGQTCTKCQTVTVAKTIAPIFECVGSSITEFPDVNGKYYMTVGYKVNHESLSEYKKYGSLEYGFVICFTSVTGSAPLVLSNGSVTPKNASQVYTAKPTLALDFYDVKIGGLSKAQNGKELLMCVYATDGESIYYLCENGQNTEAQGITLKIK